MSNAARVEAGSIRQDFAYTKTLKQKDPAHISLPIDNVGAKGGE